MPLDWLNAPIEKSIGDMVSRRRHGKAIEELRAQILQRNGTTQARLQLADLLVQAGRRLEAVPILLGLADEFASDGFAAKAVAVLKRIEKIEPGRLDVEERLSSLVRLPRSSGPAARPRSRLPEFGIEEIGSEPEPAPAIPEELATAEAPPAPEAAPVPEPVPAPEPAPSPELEPAPGVALAAEAATEVAAPESAVPEPAVAVEAVPATGEPRGGTPASAEAEPPPESDGAHRKIRSVFRRFLASLGRGDEPEPGAPGAETGVAEPTEATPVTVEPSAACPTAMLETTAPEPDPLSREPAASETPAAKPTAPEIVASEPSVLESEKSAAEPSAAPPLEAPRIPEPPAEPDSPAAVAAPEPEPGAAETESAVEPHGVTNRIRGVFRKLLGSMGSGPEPVGDPAAPAAAEDAVVASPGEAPPETAQAEPSPEPAAEPELVPNADTLTEEAFQERVLDIIEGALLQPHPEGAPAAPPAAADAPLFSGPILASPLFDDLSEEETLAVVHGLELLTFAPGDVVVTEGEAGDSLFIVTTGSVKVFVQNPAGRNLEVGRLGEGEFFGEISSLSGRPRTATITAAARCELLELDKATVDSVARTHPRVRDMLEAYYIARASSPEAAAIRAVSLDPQTKRHAIEVLEAHFGEGRWDPKVRLRLADALQKAGKEEDAIAVLIGLADDLAREGFTEKAIAVLKKIERLQSRHMEEINLAPLHKQKPRPAVVPAAAPPGPPAPAPRPRPPWAGATEDSLQGWLLDVLRERVQTAAPATVETAGPMSDPARVSGYARGLKATPLFEDLSEDELLAVIRGLRLHTPEPGDVIVTEGESGESLFVLAAGSVSVFVKNPAGRSLRLCTLSEGSFFGEMSTLSSRPRSATVTAASSCELLELDRPTLDSIVAAHPRVRTVLEEFYIERATSREAAAIRGTAT